MYDIAGQKVNVVVVELDASEADALTPQLIELGVLNPSDALTDGWLMQVQLQLLSQPLEVCRVKGNHVFGDAVVAPSIPAIDCFEHTYSCRRLSVEALTDVICMASGSNNISIRMTTNEIDVIPVFKHHFSWFTGSSQHKTS